MCYNYYSAYGAGISPPSSSGNLCEGGSHNGDFYCTVINMSIPAIFSNWVMAGEAAAVPDSARIKTYFTHLPADLTARRIAVNIIISV